MVITSVVHYLGDRLLLQLQVGMASISVADSLHIIQLVLPWHLGICGAHHRGFLHCTQSLIGLDQRRTAADCSAGLFTVLLCGKSKQHLHLHAHQAATILLLHSAGHHSLL